MKNLLLGILILAFGPLALAKFNYEGYLTDFSGNPIITSVKVKFSIKSLNGTPGACLLYDDVHTVTPNAEGYVSLTVGAGTGTNYISPLTFDQAFQNGSAITTTAPCTTTPAAGEERNVSVSVSGDNGTTWDLLGTVPLHPAQISAASEKVGNHAINSLLRVENAGVPSAASPLSPANLTELMNLITGASTLYTKSGAASGTMLVSASGTPGSANTGSMWLDTTSNEIKFKDGVGTVKTLNSAGAPVDATYAAKGLIQVDTNSATSGLDLASGVLKLAPSGVTANTYGSSTQIPQISVDAFGRVTAVNLVAVSGGSGITSLTGDVTATGPGSVAATISNSAITTAKLDNASVTYAKMQNISSNNRLLGRSTAGAGSPEEITIGSGLTLAAGTLSASAPSIDASAVTSGILAVDRGGTGAATLGSGNILVGAGTGAITSIAGSMAGNVLYATGPAAWSSSTPDTAGLMDKTSTQLVSGAKAFSNYLQMNSQSPIKFADADSSNYVGLRSPATVSSNIMFTLPAADGTASQVLQTDGMGNLSWASAPNALPIAGGAMTGAIQGTPGTAATPGFSFSGDAVTGIYRPASNVMGFSTNGSEKMRIDNFGNVGIGTSSPAAPLHIRTSSNVAALNIEQGGSGTNPSLISIIPYGTVSGMNPSWMVGIPPGGSNVFDVAAFDGTTTNSRFAIAPNGNIGINNMGPMEKLHLTGGNIRTTNGQQYSDAYTVASGVNVDFNNGNTQILLAPGGGGLNLTNLKSGGRYTVIIADMTSRMYTFGGCAVAKFSPANVTTTASTHTVYEIRAFMNGTMNCYISWASYQ